MPEPTPLNTGISEHFEKQLTQAGIFQQVLEIVGSECKPEDVFDEVELEKWAEDHGWIPAP